MLDSHTLTILVSSLLGIWSIVVVLSTYMISQHKNSLAVRTRGYSITILLTVCQYFIVLGLSIKLILLNQVPCFIKLWLSGLLLPLWAATLLARFLRVLFLNRINLIQLKLSKLIGNNKNDSNDSYELTNIRSVKSNNMNLSINMSNDNNQPINLNTFTKVDSWLYKNRMWFRAKGLSLSLLGFWFLNLILTLLFQILSSYIKSDNQNTLVGTKCPNVWTIYPSLFITLLTLIIEWPIFFLLIKDMFETFGVRLELVTNLILAPLFLCVFTLDIVMDFDVDNLYYQLFCFLLIAFICLMHVLTISYPLLWSKYKLTFNKRRNVINKIGIKNTTKNKVNSTNNSNKNDNIMSISLKQILEDSEKFNDFKTFAAHNFCVENVLFYEQYQHLKHGDYSDNSSTTNLQEDVSDNIKITLSNQEDWQATLRSQYTLSLAYLPSENKPPPRQSMPLSTMESNQLAIKESTSFNFNLSSSSKDINCATPQSPQQQQILSIYKQFIASDSPVQLNLTGFTKKSIQEKLKQGIITTQIFDVAYDEVYAMLLQDVFPRYLNALQNGRVIGA